MDKKEAVKAQQVSTSPPAGSNVPQSWQPDNGPAGDKMAAARKGKKPAPANETKAQKFRRLANYRVPKALKALAAVENLGSRSQYEMTEQQADKIIEALGVACQRVFARLKGAEADTAKFSV